jgi:hypothetical protein
MLITASRVGALSARPNESGQYEQSGLFFNGYKLRAVVSEQEEMSWDEQARELVDILRRADPEVAVQLLAHTGKRSSGREWTKAHIQGVSTGAAVGLNMCPTSLPSLVTS